MKTQRTWPYISLAALMGLAGCSTSRQTAQNTGEMDDLYATSANAVVYEGNRQQSQSTARLEEPRFSTRQRDLRNINPDYATNDEKRGYDPNSDEYYTELSTRNIKRGLSADPGWSSGASGYNDGFTDGYYAGLGNPSFNSARWNPWGWNNGLSLGLGFGSAFGSPFGFNNWGYGGGFHNRFNDPFWGGGFGSYAYSPFGFGNSFGHGGFGSPFGFGGFGSPFGYNNWGYGGGFGGFGGFGNPIIVNNTIITGADPYRNNRTYGARGTATTNRYNGDFNNTPRNYNPNGGGRQANGSSPAYSGNAGSTNTGSSDGYYAAPRSNSRGSYYYENGGSGASGNSARTSTAPNSTYNNNSGNSSNGGYYSAPRQNSRGTYTAPAPSDNGGGYNNRGSQPSYQAPQQQRSSYESRPSYSQPSQSQSSQPSYSAPSSSGGSRGGGSYSAPSSSGSSSGGGGGGSRGPR